MTFAQMLNAILQNNETTQSRQPAQLPSNLIESLENIGAFRGKPSYRYILAAMLRTTLAEKATDRYAPTEETQALIERFITHTGFQPKQVYAITEALASASGITKHPTYEQSHFHTTNTQTPTTKDLITYLNSIIQINREAESHRRVTLINPAITAIEPSTATTPSNIRLTATLRRTHPQGSATLHYALYTQRQTQHNTTPSEATQTQHFDTPTQTTAPHKPQQDSHASTANTSHLTLLHTGIAGTFTILSPNPHPLEVKIPCKPNDIALILLYLD